MTEPNNAYYTGILKQITPDGVSPVTNHYAWERVGGGNSRVSKAGFMDVLEFTGIDNRYYNNEQLQKFHRWLFGSSINCAREMAIFGDMLPTQGIGNYLLHRRVVNFDMEAAGYAAWYLNGEKANGTKLNLYYLTPPLEINIEKSQSAVPDRYPGYPDHNRLESVYNLDASGAKNLTTILLPEKTNSSQVYFKSLNDDNFNACEIILKGNISDYIYESLNNQLIENGDFSFQGELVIARMSGKKVNAYFLKNATLFTSNEIGMESDNPVTIYYSENKGAVITTGAKLKITGSGAQNLTFGSGATVLTSGTNFIEIQLSAGTYNF